jgi:hypothetical protein
MTLPTEVLASILAHLRDDPNKTALAQCMRVSKFFKAIAAPLLYEKLDWKHMTRDPMRLIENGKGTVITQGVLEMSTKEEELQHIKFVEVQSHSHDNCPFPSGGARQEPLTVPVLRIVMNGRQSHDDDTCLERRLCPLLKGLATKKLVVFSRSYDRPIKVDRSEAGPPQEHVVKIEVFPVNCLGLNLHLESEAKRLIIILEHFERAIPRHASNETHMIRQCVFHMATQLVFSRRLRYPVQSFVMVNFAQLDAEYLLPESHPGGTFEALCNKIDNESQPEIWDIGPRQAWRTLAERASVSTKFITMKEYLREYDWNGVYTTDEVAELLKEQPSEG